VRTPYAPPECNIYVNPHKNRLLEILRTEFFACYRAGYDQHKQCSLDFSEEIETYLRMPDMPDKEQEKLRWVREKLSKV
jgi:hypothetical protein